MTAQRHIISKISLLLIVGLLLTQIFVSNQLATAGAHLSQLEQQIQSATEENRRLQQLIIQQTSLSRLNHQAEQWGFNSRPTIVSITPSPEVVLSQ